MGNLGPMTDEGSRATFWILLAVVGVSAGLTHLLNAPGFPAYSGEESSLIGRAQQHAEKGEWYSPGFEYQAPFGAPWLLARLFDVTGGASWESARVFVGLLAVGDALLLYLLVTRLRNPVAGAAAALLFTLSAAGFGEFRRVIIPSFGVFFTLAALAILVNRVPGKPILAGLAYGLALFTDAAAVAALPALVLVLARTFRARPIPHATFGLLALLLAAMWPLQAVFSGAGIAPWVEGVGKSLDGASLEPLQALLAGGPLLVLVGLASAVYLAVRERELFPAVWLGGGLVLFLVASPVLESEVVNLVPALCVALGLATASLAAMATVRVREWLERSEGATPLGASGAATVQSLVVAVLVLLPLAVPAEGAPLVPPFWVDRNADVDAATDLIASLASPGDVVVAGGAGKVALRAHGLKVYDWYRDDLLEKGVRFLLMDKNAKYDVKTGCSGNCPDLKPLYDQSAPVEGGRFGEYEVRRIAS